MDVCFLFYFSSNKQQILSFPTCFIRRGVKNQNKKKFNRKMVENHDHCRDHDFVKISLCCYKI